MKGVNERVYTHHLCDSSSFTGGVWGGMHLRYPLYLQQPDEIWIGWLQEMRNNCARTRCGLSPESTVPPLANPQYYP
jgi:hypothetical protein